MRLPRDVAGFDSASAMVMATARFLRGREALPLGRSAARALLPLAVAANRLPARAREAIYSVTSGAEARPPDRLARVDIERIAAEFVRLYPRRRYPAAALGSSNGALVHLCAALGIPWLPQTLLLPLRQQHVPPDDAEQAAGAFTATARQLLARNPDLVLHQMHDPNQDRLTSRRMAYFRVKRTRLGPTYERFLADTLAPGAVLYVAECTQRWPTTRLGERHVFQFGAVGGLGPGEYRGDDPRIAAYLRRYGVPRTRWEAPAPDGDSPEAEWGFEPALRDDVLAFARRHGYRVRRLVFEDPEDLSPLVADFYRWWYRERGLAGDRLLVESFIMLAPRWALRSGSVPYWSVFPVDSSADALLRYLQRAEYDVIRVTLFCHGVESVGLAGVPRWREVVRQARCDGGFAGVDVARFPNDLAALFRYQRDLRATPGPRYPLPEPLPVAAFDTFAAAYQERHPAVTVEELR